MKGFLRAKHLGIPSAFDIGVILFILILPIFRYRNYSTGMMSGIFLVFGTIALMCLALGIKPRRGYKSLPLAILTIWGLIGVFWHSFSGALSDFGKFAINWTLHNEGYIFIFFGAYLIHTVVRNAKAWGWYYPALIFSSIWTYKYIFDINRDADWSMTPMFAVLIAATIVILRKLKKWWLSAPIVLTGLCLAVSKWSYILQKWKSRPDFWKVCLERLRLSHFLGKGYYHTINTMDGFVATEQGGKGAEYVIDRWGRGWRHNDWLECGEYLGIVGLVVVAWFFINLLWKGKVGLAYFYVLAATLMCLFQRTMFFPVKGGIIVIMLIMLILETGGKCGVVEAEAT